MSTSGRRVRAFATALAMSFLTMGAPAFGVISSHSATFTFSAAKAAAAQGLKPRLFSSASPAAAEPTDPLT